VVTGLSMTSKGASKQIGDFTPFCKKNINQKTKKGTNTSQKKAHNELPYLH